MSSIAATLRDPPTAGRQFDIGATDDSLALMRELSARHGDTWRVYAPGRGSFTYVINHPDDVKRVLVGNHRNYTKGIGLDRVRILLGNGIMVSEGELWKRQRYMMQPLFHRRVIAGCARLIDEANERLIGRWTALAAAGAPVNLTDEMSGLTLDVVLHAIFGDDLARLERELGENPFALLTRESARDLRFAWHFRSLTRMVAELIARRRAEAVEHFDYVAMLMNARDRESGEPMSERQLIDEIMTLIVAGHETTANGLAWVWYLLAGHPEAEARLHAEIDAVPEAPAPSLAAMEALRYTRQVIDEALRLYPPGWLLSRRAIGPDALSGCDLPAGADVLISPFLLHRHPGYWEAPEAFRPERFAPEQAAERSRFAYIPFAAGPRHCIGESFALYEMLIHLYRVARRFRLRRSTDEPIELEAQVNLRTRRPLMMRLERRA